MIVVQKGRGRVFFMPNCLTARPLQEVIKIQPSVTMNLILKICFKFFAKNRSNFLFFGPAPFYFFLKKAHPVSEMI